MDDLIQVLLVEDSRSFSRVIELALSEDEMIKGVVSFGSAEAALRSLLQIEGRGVDIIILDISLPGMSGLEAIPHFQNELREVPILILSQSNEEAVVVEALSLGATGYLLKSSTSEEICNAVRKVVNGGTAFDLGVSKYVIDTLRKQPRKVEQDFQLSKRELETLILMAQGLSRKEIAGELGVSISTVVTHINRIYRKLKVPNAPAAISKGYRCGLLD